MEQCQGRWERLLSDSVGDSKLFQVSCSGSFNFEVGMLTSRSIKQPLSKIRNVGPKLSASQAGSLLGTGPPCMALVSEMDLVGRSSPQDKAGSTW